MTQYIITQEQIESFKEYLYQEERAQATIDKYTRDVRRLYMWLEGRSMTKEMVVQWKEHLSEQGYCAMSINGVIAALHSFFSFLGWTELRAKYLKVQRQMFRDSAKELRKDEYQKLVQTAEKTGNKRLALLLETICGTGVRVSEVKYITVEALKNGRVDISLKGKIRSILIPNKLARKLKVYVKKQKIVFGEIFITKNGNGMSRRQIWGELKKIAGLAGVDEHKVFPHNLRHLFARAFYSASRDIVKLANVLGHSSIETTRIYLMTTHQEHTRILDGLGLVL